MPAKVPLPERPARASRARLASGRSLTSLAGPLIRALHQVDAACMRALNNSVGDDARACALLEVHMWAPLHRALSNHLAQNHTDVERIDSLLADDLLAFVDEVLLWVADVEAGGERRATRYLGACRQRLGELAAFGGDARGLRQQLDKIVQHMASPGAESQDLAVPLAVLHGSIAAAVDAKQPRIKHTLLDQIAM